MPRAWFDPATATARATRTATATLTPRPTATATPSPAPFAAGAVRAPAPYFAFRRPFEPPDVVVGSRFYPFGIDAGGQYLMHHGIDIGNPMGTQVHAIGDGRVIFAGRDDVLRWGPTTDFYGRLVVVEHAERLGSAPLYSLYGHLAEALVKTGQAVARGEALGLVGAEGVALGPHLHLELRTRSREYDAAINPELMLAPLEGHGTIVGRALDAGGHAVAGAHISLYALDADGSTRFAFQTTTYPPEGPSPAWRWDEGFVFADLPAGRYAVVCDALGARAEVEVAPEGAVLAVLRAAAADR